MDVAVSLGLVCGGALAIVWGAELFAEHLSGAAARLGVSSFALAVLLAGAEPEELVTAVTASLRDAPGVAVGDVIGANVTICLVAFGAAALVSPVRFGPAIQPYAFGGLVAACAAGVIVWDGAVGRGGGTLLILLYIGFVAAIWWRERRPPALGETAEIDDAIASAASAASPRRRIGREMALSVVGVGALAVGSIAVVEAVVRLTSVEKTQTVLGLTLVGFATAAELVVLAWSAARRGMPETVVAAIVGSFAYNVTMTLGAAALARPIALGDPGVLRGPWIAMLASLALIVVLGSRRRGLGRSDGIALLLLYPLFVATVALR
jgi:cation:H+ antiporter